MLRALLIALFMLFSPISHGAEPFSPLPADQAFLFSAYFQPNHQLTFDWKIAPGYYLYKNQINVKSSNAQTGQLVFPAGVMRKDLVHGVYTAYFQQLKIIVPIVNAQANEIDLEVHYQGCSSKGFCYAPIQKKLRVNLSTQSVSAADNKDDYFSKLFQHNLAIVILIFLGIGLLLAFTPCVLPMVPILSAIILGHQKKTDKRKGFLLSLVYVLGMALTYAAAGVVVALIGSSVQAYLEQPWVIILFSAIFVLLALTLFDVYELQLPPAWQQHISDWSNKQKGGTYLGVFLMGSFSTLIVSPCVSAPLVGVLAYIGKTGDTFLGAISLLALGIGMGIPLLLIGISAQKWLPKAGRWMLIIERLFGVMMLVIAVWLLARIIPDPVVKDGYFTVIHSTQDLNQQLKQAQIKHQPVMLDFYADWCSACVTMNHYVFARADVQQALHSFKVLQVDVTANNTFDQAITKQFQVVGPPTILFFVNGKELTEQRIVGEVSEKEFITRVRGLHASQ